MRAIARLGVINKLDKVNIMIDEVANNACIGVADDKHSLMIAEQRIEKLICELKEKEAEKAHYIKENDFLREALRRIIGD